METNISMSLITATLVSLMFLTFGGLAHDAYAVTVITVQDEDSCEALSVSGGTADFNNDICMIPPSATLEIAADEVLNLRVYVYSLGIINNAQGGTINITGTGSLTVNVDFSSDFGGELNNFGTINIESPGGLSSSFSGEVNNFGTINVRAGGNFGIGTAVFTNAPNGIVNNYGYITGWSDGPRFRNDGIINNYANGVISLGDANFSNNAKGVINNHGLMHQDTLAETGKFHSAGVINNYGEVAANANTAPGGLFNNFGTIEIGSSQVLHIEGHLSNHGDIRNDRGRIFNDGGTIVNQAVGSIANFDQFINSGSINNQGVISNYCGNTFTNSGSITGNPVKNACESVPPAITAPADVTLTTTGTRLNLCKNIAISGISAIGDDGAGNVAANTLDNNLGTRWSHGGAASWIRPDLGSTKVICSVDIAWYKGDQRTYNFAISTSNDGINFKKVFTGHSSGTTLSPERFEFADSVGRYVKIIVNANSVNIFASVTEMDVNGYTSLGLPVVSDNRDPFPLVKNSVPSNGLPIGSNTVIWTATDANGNTNSVYTQLVKVVAGDTTLPTIAITSPATGSTITGPANAVKVSLTGKATDSGSGVQKVEIKSLKGGVEVHPYQLVTPNSPGNWGTWTHTLTFTQTGTYTITPRATDTAGNQNWNSITVKIAFQADTTIPTVSITSPQNGASFSGPSSVPKKISLAGIAADSGSGVQKVELKSLKSGVGVHAYQQASTSNNWANWTHTLSFSTSGTYTITARVTDIAGNQNWHSITVNITLR